jgi:hypothetical protein
MDGGRSAGQGSDRPIDFNVHRRDVAYGKPGAEIKRRDHPELPIGKSSVAIYCRSSAKIIFRFR